MKFLRILVHGAPIIPLFWGRFYLAIAGLLFILLCYIKVFKLRQQLADLREKGGNPDLESSLQRALMRWHALTFLNAT